MRARAIVLLFLLISFASASSAADSRSPREQYAALTDLKLDPSAVYSLPAGSRIELQRGDTQLTFEEGRLALFAALDGQITGAVFSGRGHILAAPRDPVEKQQLALFTGAPLLDQTIASVYLRFTDDTAGELQRELQDAKISPREDFSFVSRWNTSLSSFNALHSLRILATSLTENPRPYFYAALEGLATGPFDFVFDQERDEPMFLGQARKINDTTYYDVWASYSLPGITPHSVAFRASKYILEATIQSDMTLDGVATIQLRAESGGDRFLSFQFARNLQLKSVTTGSGQSLDFFQNEGMTPQQRELQGNDVAFVVLPSAPKPGEEFRLVFRYSGRVIRDSGNGVFFVSARDSWYPHLGDASDFSQYEMTFRWPRRLKLVATGTTLDEKEDGDSRVGHWKTESPAAVAGFNLGEYAVASVTSQRYSIDVYANRQLEMALQQRLRSSTEEIIPQLTPFPTPGSGPAGRLQLPSTEPSPADELRRLAKEIDSSIRFYEGFSGPFPFRQLAVSQIPGTFGQGWPGLLYLSTYSFLPTVAQEKAGLSAAGQEHFSELVPFHEVAHQWWGNVVGWSGYRDQWVDEALASYTALLFADSQKTPDRRMHVWLDRYRNKLEEKLPNSTLIPADIGSLSLGNRLSSSKAPEGFEVVIYSKGAWVIHMIREMLRQPGAKNPDAKFQSFLQTLYKKYQYRALSTLDLQKELDAVMTPAMDLDGNHSMEWFIEDWVRGVGVPHYRIEYTTRKSEKGFVIKGKLFQLRVPRGFVAAVPIHSSNGAFLGRVIASGEETQFHFTTATDPGKLQIDPQMTILCIVDHSH
ncbi:MAG TPA: M1 family aminopeptidase [Candidatus Acidoferrum sp.]|nr:M1 family aminopeptidase [Candidatus Acidoferrum sp.]